MSLSTCDFRAAIREASSAAGRAPTPAQIENLDAALKSLAALGEGGHVVVQLVDGSVSIGNYLAEEVARFDRVPRAPIPTPLLTQADRDAEAGILRVGGYVMHGRPRGDAFADLARGFQAADAAKLAREAATWPNPWKAGAENRTRQVILNRTYPDKAARFREEAGVAS